MNILHGDLKGANIFLSENENSIKLGDLNVSKVAKTITHKHINIKFLLYNNYTNSYTSVLLETVFQNLD